MNKNGKSYHIPQRADGKKTFERIVQTGERLFTLNGFFGTSINEIIAEAEIATGTFYLYFTDKKALYLYLVDHYGEEISKAIRTEIKHAKTRYEQERSGLKAFLLYALKNPISYRIFWEAMYVDMDVFKNYYQNFALRYMHMLNRAVEAHEVRSDIDLETLSYMLMGISNFVGLQVLFDPNANEKTIDFLTDETMKLLEAGMFIKKRP